MTTKRTIDTNGYDPTTTGSNSNSNNSKRISTEQEVATKNTPHDTHYSVRDCNKPIMAGDVTKQIDSSKRNNCSSSKPMTNGNHDCSTGTNSNSSSINMNGIIGTIMPSSDILHRHTSKVSTNGSKCIESFYNSIQVTRHHRTPRIVVDDSSDNDTNCTTSTPSSSEPFDKKIFTGSSIVQQTIQVGDLIPIRTTIAPNNTQNGESTNSASSSVEISSDFMVTDREPFTAQYNKDLYDTTTSWSIGQILSLYSTIIPSSTTSSDPTTESTIEATSYHAHVQWYIPFKSKMAELLIQENDLLVLKKQFRTKFMLFEQQSVVDIIPLTADTILPGSIIVNSIIPSKFDDATTSTEVAIGCYEIPFFCKRRIAIVNTTPVPCNNNTTMSYLESCIRGWDYLQKSNPDVFDPSSIVRTKMTDFLNSTSSTKIVSRFRTISHKPLLPTTTTTSATKTQVKINSNGNSDDTKDKDVTESKKEKLDRKQPNKQHDESKDSKERRGKRISFSSPLTMDGKQPLSEESSKYQGIQGLIDSNRKDECKKDILKSIMKETSSLSSSSSSSTNEIIRKRKSYDNLFQQDKKVKIVQSGSQTSFPCPLGNVAYNYKLPPNDVQATSIKTIWFYTHATLQVNWDCFVGKTLKHRRSKNTYNIQVGDVIAMACTDSIPEQPIYTTTTIGSTSSSSVIDVEVQCPSYPFNISWSPAQIVAIYRKKWKKDAPGGDKEDELYVQVRWLYRPNEVSEEVQEMFTPQLNDLFFPSEQHFETVKKVLNKLTTNETSVAIAERTILSGRNYIEVDYNYDEAPAAGILGRIDVKNRFCITSDCDWLSSFISTDGIPQVPILCQYASFYHIPRTVCESMGQPIPMMMDELIPVPDWITNELHGPTNRMLLAPSGYPERIRQLRKIYESFLQHQHPESKERIGTKLKDGIKPKIDTTIKKSRADTATNENEKVVNVVESPDAKFELKDYSCWPRELLTGIITEKENRSENNNSELFHTQDIGKGTQRAFFKSTSVQFIPRLCDPRATGKKSSLSVTEEWTVQVGDIVCIARDFPLRPPCDTQRTNQINAKVINKNPWYPFLGPWMVGQILSIYRDKNLSGTTGMMMEVRWFYRAPNFQEYIVPWMPPCSTSTNSEISIFETDKVDEGIQISFVLGLVDLYLGHQKTVLRSQMDNGTTNVPTVSCRCQYFYFSYQEQFQLLYSLAVEPDQWFNLLLQRGLRSSSLICSDNLLLQVVECLFEIDLAKRSKRGNDSSFVGSLFQCLQTFGEVEDDDKNNELYAVPLDLSEGTRKYFLSVEMTPIWSEILESAIICSTSDKRRIRWRVRIGDIVAVRITDQTDSGNNKFPFRCPWRPAQVLSFFSESSANGYRNIKVQLRWFYRRSDHPSLHNVESCTGLPSIFETDDVSSVYYDWTSLLGPINLKFSDVDQDSSWQYAPRFLPSLLFLYSGCFDVNECCKMQQSSAGIVQRAIESAGVYGLNGCSFVMDALRKDYDKAKDRTKFGQMCMQLLVNNTPILKRAVSNDTSLLEEEAAEAAEAITSVPPFHVDRTSGIEYYTEIDVKPPSVLYATGTEQSPNGAGAVWTVRLGDIVSLRYDEPNISTKGSYGMQSIEYPKGGRNWPFTTPWAVAEVVNIMKNTSESTGSEVSESSLELEVRWFYRKCEIKGMTTATKADGYEFCAEEIFETDQCVDVDVSVLLGPVDLHENPVTVRQPKTRTGMPVLDFFCKRFFSVHRKSLLPIAGLHGRVNRGQSNSPRIGRDVALRVALERIFADKITSAEPDPNLAYTPATTWEDSFQNVINKLSLTDASKEAYEKSSVLIGRESEQRQIMSFLRSSIRGDRGDAAKPSIFIAGPPGVGKTACVRAVISDLKREQAAGHIPSFDFVPLNGMEMQNPHEAFVKLWGEMNPWDKWSVTPETAAKKLENYFSGKKTKSESNQKRVVVVLLDEIDYLVTQKQTVLYNFFDWPIRSVERGSNKRLIVIGVSNTLNLPERLHPRIQSRIGSKRIFFRAYNVEEAESILRAKVKQASPDYEVIDDDAILFAAKKTAALSGDIRKAFSICRRATEMVLHEAQLDSSSFDHDSGPSVRIKDVLQISKESSTTAHTQAVSMCTSLEVLLLVAVTSLASKSGREYGKFDIEEIVTKMEGIANATGNYMYIPAPSITETLELISRLGEANLIGLYTPRNSSLTYRESMVCCGGSWPLVSLVVDDHLLLHALKDTVHYDLARQHITLDY